MTDSKAKIVLETNAREAVKGINNINEALGKMSNQIEKNSNVIGENTLKWSVYTQGLYSSLELLKNASNYAKSAFDYLREGANFAEAEKNFKAYTNSIGKSADELILKFRKATKNQVSDIELMKSATKALRVAGIQDIEALEKIYQIADTKGDLLGLSLQETFDKIVSAISSGNGKALVELGVLPEKFARVSNSADLLKNRTNLLKEVIKQSEVDFKALGSVGETSANKFNQLETAVSNLNREFKIELSEALIPTVDFARNEGIPVAKTVIGWFKDVVEVLKKVEKQSGLLTDAVGVTVSAFGALTAGSVITGLSSMVTQLKAAKDAQIAFNIAALKNPYVIVGSLGVGTIAYDTYLGYGIKQANDNTNKNYEKLKNSPNIIERLHYEEYETTEKLNALGDKGNLLNRKKELKQKIEDLGFFKDTLFSSWNKKYGKEILEIDEKIKLIDQYTNKIENIKNSISTIVKQQHALVVEAEKVAQLKTWEDIFETNFSSGDKFKSAENMLNLAPFVSLSPNFSFNGFIEDTEAIKNLEKEAEKRSQDFIQLNNKVKDSLLKSIGAVEPRIENMIPLMHNVGLASLGLGAKVDEGAAKAYEASKKLNDEIERMQSAFDESVNKENVATEFAIELENLYRDDMPTRFLDTLISINELDFKGTVKGLKDISSALQGNYADIYFSNIPRLTSAPTESQKQEQMNKASAVMSAFGMNLFTAIPTNTKQGIIPAKGVKATEETIKKTASYAGQQFKEGIANAIADGFASADFSGFASSLQSVISGVVGNGISSSLTEALTKTSSGNLGGLFGKVVNADAGQKGKVSLGALGSNLLTGGLISTATNFLFGEGGIFGKTKIVGKENLNKSAELNAQVDQAKELAESIYLATGISDATRELIDNAVYNKTWTTTSKSKNIFKKKKTISLHGAEQAQASIKYVEDLQKQALGEQALNNYNNYMLGRDNSVAAALSNYQDAQKAYDASQVMLYSDEENAGFRSDLSAKQKRIKELESYKKDKKKAAQNGYGYYWGGRYYSNNYQIDYGINNLNNEIASLREKLNSSYKYDLETRTEMLQQMEEAHVNYIKAQQDARSNLLSNFTGSSTLASLAGGSSDSVMDMLLGNKDVMGNSDMIEAMMPLLEQAYTKDFDLNQRLNSEDDEVRKAAQIEQQSILEQARDSMEKIYKDAKDEALNSDLSTEERSAAFERWQESFQAFLSLQEQIAENTKTIADLEESNALSKLSTELGDMLSVVAEIKNQKSTNNTLVFRQSMNVEEIIGKLKEIAGAKNPELASVLGEILNDKANASIWG